MGPLRGVVQFFFPTSRHRAFRLNVAGWIFGHFHRSALSCFSVWGRWLLSGLLAAVAWSTQHIQRWFMCRWAISGDRGEGMGDYTHANRILRPLLPAASESAYIYFS